MDKEGVRDGRVPLTPLVGHAIHPLEEGVVQVYKASVDLAGEEISRLEPLLAQDERQWLHRLRFDRDRRRYAAGRVCLRWLLARHLGRNPAELRFRSTGNGKPALASPDDVTDLHFNMSSSGDIALFAIALKNRVGIDIERIRWDLDFEPIAERLFSRSEREALRQLPPELRTPAFFRCWTRKEAYVKALGLGLSLPLDTFDVGVTAIASPGPRSIPQPSGGELFLQDVDVEEGYAAAIVVDGRPSSVPRVAAPISASLAELISSFEL